VECIEPATPILEIDIALGELEANVGDIVDEQNEDADFMIPATKKTAQFSLKTSYTPFDTYYITWWPNLDDFVVTYLAMTSHGLLMTATLGMTSSRTMAYSRWRTELACLSLSN
jgi:hypothetical protein